jgi:predicted nucleic acid-binding protein
MALPRRKTSVAKKKKPLQSFVLDSSVTLAWYFADEANAYANGVAERLAKVRGIVPSIWPLEIANVLVASERRKRSTQAQAARWLSGLQLLPIDIEHTVVATAWGEVLRLARTHDLSAYDASYLELALRCGLPLATLDEPLRQALRRVGGALYLAE